MPQNALYQQPEIPNFAESYGKGLEMRTRADYNALASMRQQAQGQEVQINAMKIDEAEHTIAKRPEAEKVAVLDRIYKNYKVPMQMIVRKYEEFKKQDPEKADELIKPIYDQLAQIYAADPDVQKLGVKVPPVYNHMNMLKGMENIEDILGKSGSQNFSPIYTDQGIGSFNKSTGEANILEGLTKSGNVSGGKGGAGTRFIQHVNEYMKTTIKDPATGKTRTLTRNEAQARAEILEKMGKSLSDDRLLIEYQKLYGYDEGRRLANDVIEERNSGYNVEKNPLRPKEMRPLPTF